MTNKHPWVKFDTVEDVWAILKESVDAGKPVKGWDWVNIG